MSEIRSSGSAGLPRRAGRGIRPAQPTLRVLVAGPPGFVGQALRETLAAAPGVTLAGGAVDALDATDAAREVRPDVVVLDADAAPDAWTDVVRVLATGPGRPIVVVLATDGSPARIREAVSAGARGFLTKDLSADALRRAVAGIAKGELAMSRQAAAIALGRLAAPEPGAWPSPDPRLTRLTARELEVLRLVATGLRDRDVADRLGLSVRTVESHVARILRRLEVRNRAEATSCLHGEAAPTR